MSSQPSPVKITRGRDRPNQASQWPVVCWPNPSARRELSRENKQKEGEKQGSRLSRTRFQNSKNKTRKVSVAGAGEISHVEDMGD